MFVKWVTYHHHHHPQRLCDGGAHYLHGQTQGKSTEQPGGVNKGTVGVRAKGKQGGQMVLFN